MESQNIRNFLNMAAATTHFLALTILFLAGPVIVILIICFTQFWFIAIGYLIWIWIIDKDTPEKGGRIIRWCQTLKFYNYVRDYYPITLKAVPGFNLDPKRNYMFCSFPHGIMPNGVTVAFLSTACGIDKILPHHTTQILSLHINFKIPIYREYMLSLGSSSVTPKSINWLLSDTSGGRVAVILVGGASEAAYSCPGVYKIVLKNRKGFVKLALKNGSPLVPVFSFGEIDTFIQLDNKKGSLLWSVQEWIKKKTGVLPLFFSGRRFYRNWVSLVPYKKPINIIIGNPIEVVQNTNPTQEDIDTLHQHFITDISKLFEEYKHKYIKNAKQTKLEIV